MNTELIPKEKIDAWAKSRESSEQLIVAIFAIADDYDDADLIFEYPKQRHIDHIKTFINDDHSEIIWGESDTFEGSKTLAEI